MEELSRAPLGITLDTAHTRPSSRRNDAMDCAARAKPAAVAGSRAPNEGLFSEEEFRRTPSRLGERLLHTNVRPPSRRSDAMVCPAGMTPAAVAGSPAPGD